MSHTACTCWCIQEAYSNFEYLSGAAEQGAPPPSFPPLSPSCPLSSSSCPFVTVTNELQEQIATEVSILT